MASVEHTLMTLGYVERRRAGWPEGLLNLDEFLTQDSCPECLERHVIPCRVRIIGDSMRADYVCSVCSHRWWTSRRVGAIG